MDCPCDLRGKWRLQCAEYNNANSVNARLGRSCYVTKLTIAAQLSFVERPLLQAHNQFLVNINNQVKVRWLTRSEVPGTARDMSYEDRMRARADRARKEIAEKAKRASREAKRKRAARKPKEPEYHA